MSCAAYFALNKDGSQVAACPVDYLMCHVPASLACAVSALCALTSCGTESLIGVCGDDGRGKGWPFGNLDKNVEA